MGVAGKARLPGTADLGNSRAASATAPERKALAYATLADFNSESFAGAQDALGWPAQAMR
jgi:hypothetical protein